MNKYQQGPLIFWIGLSLLVIILSYKLGLEDKTSVEGAYNPGPGLMPFLAALALLLVALFLFLRSLFRKRSQTQTVESEKERPGQIDFWKIIFVLAALFGYAFLLETLGYVVVTCLIMILLFHVMGTGWKNTLGMSIVTVLITYFVFTYLGLLFPEGIFRFRGVLR